MAVIFAAPWAEGGGGPASPWKAWLSLLKGGGTVDPLVIANFLMDTGAFKFSLT